jgi:sigma-B regulation protein RsbU (phosphoserine phosphatase)
MRAAQDIQRQILPPARGRFGPLSYALQIYPGQIVAGDLFDIFPVDPGRVAFFIGDVVGKGLPAALVMAVTQTALSACLRRGDDLAQAVQHANAHLIRTLPDNRFVSLWCGVVELSTGKVRYVDAGHGYALLRLPGADARPVASEGGPPLRCADEPYAIDELTLSPGSRLWLYSDGVIEQPGPTGELFGLQRTLAALAPPRSAEAELDDLVRGVRQHAGANGTHGLADDLTVVALSFDP